LRSNWLKQTRQKCQTATHTDNEIRVIEVIDDNPQELREGDYERFCNFMQDKINQNDDFLKFVMFSDEAKFCNNGAVNRHNCHYYALENPRWIRQTHFQRILSEMHVGSIMMVLHHILYE
ncbi:hypothetical protein BDFB_008030, partial [Asbolus verrucosus]